VFYPCSAPPLEENQAKKKKKAKSKKKRRKKNIKSQSLLRLQPLRLVALFRPFAGIVMASAFKSMIRPPISSRSPSSFFVSPSYPETT
jgi:hypothetical protein